MQLEDYFDFEDAELIRIKGHRIGIEHVVALYQEGYSPEQIMQEFPGLSLEQIHATITYFLRNREFVDIYIAQSRERAERAYQEWAAHPSPLIQRLRAFCDRQVPQSS